MNNELAAQAAVYRERAAEMRALADRLKNEHQEWLVVKATENYEKMAETVEQESAQRHASGSG